MHTGITHSYSNALQRNVAAIVLYKAPKRGAAPVAVCSFPAYLNGYRVPSTSLCNAYLRTTSVVTV